MYRYAQRKKSAAKMLAVPMESRCLNTSFWSGPVGAILGGHMYHANFAFDIDENPDRFDEEIRKLAERIRKLVEKG